jgi:hypothetical protein
MATITAAGAIPTDPTTLRNELLAVATALSPGLTANLPASLVEDMASTATGAVVIQDQAYVDLVNSISPYTANDYILTQLGNVYGVQQGIGSNTSVLVEFDGTVGFVINAGFIVSDGTYQYVVQDATIIPSGGASTPVYCLATIPGSWAVPADTVTVLITSVPAGVTLNCYNPNDGTPGSAPQTIAQYRAQVIQAGRAVATGIPTLLKTALQNVSGVQQRLVSVRPVGGGFQILVSAGDPYEVANAIFQSMFNYSDLQPASSIGTTENITIYDYPDSYVITFVVPTAQTVGVTVYWETAAGTNFVSNTVVAAAVQPALVAYVNSIFVGQDISILELQATFLAATVGIINPINISALSFVVTIDSVVITPAAGSVLIAGDPEGYFNTAIGNILVLNEAPP